MKAFAELYQALDASTGTQAKVAAMAAYLRTAAPADAAWAVYFLAGGKPRQVVPVALLRTLACQAAGIPDWLFEESYALAGDLAETIAYLTPPPTESASRTLGAWMEERLAPLRGLPPAEQAERVLADWRQLDADQRFLYIKLIGGGFRVGVSRLLVQRALAEAFGLDAKVIAHRMMGYTDGKTPPSAARFAALVDPAADAARDGVHPYPFFLAHALDAPPESLGPVSDWQVEWKYDGIRAQLMRRGSQCALWSRGEELVSDRFPELMALAERLPDGTVLDGEIVVWLDAATGPAAFALLQTRIGRKTLTPKVLREAPVRFLAYDLLEADGEDLRAQPQHARRARLEALAEAHGVGLSPLVVAGSWEGLAALRAESRARGVEGFMLKHRNSCYGSGRTKSEGVWWKWKIEPMSVDAVLIYAQAGHGRRANVYTDYTFAVWNRPPADADEAAAVVEAIRARRPPVPGALQLVPFAKAYSGLSDAEFARVDRIIRQNTVDKFGPVRSVAPSLVFELGFEGLQASKRHRSGIATRFPRMLRIRDDKPLHEAGTLAELQALAAQSGAAGSPAGEAVTDDDEAASARLGKRPAEGLKASG